MNTNSKFFDAEFVVLHVGSEIAEDGELSRKFRICPESGSVLAGPEHVGGQLVGFRRKSDPHGIVTRSINHMGKSEMLVPIFNDILGRRVETTDNDVILKITLK